MSFSGAPELTEPEYIGNDAFWGDIDMNELVVKYRIPAEYETSVTQTGLVLAMVRVNEALNAVKLAINASNPGATFAQYWDANPTDQVDGVFVPIFEYKNAVFCHAKAFLLQQFNSLNRRKEAENQAKESPEMETFWLNESRQSIYSVLKLFVDNPGLPDHNTFVALI